MQQHDEAIGGGAAYIEEALLGTYGGCDDSEEVPHTRLGNGRGAHRSLTLLPGLHFRRRTSLYCGS